MCIYIYIHMYIQVCVRNFYISNHLGCYDFVLARNRSLCALSWSETMQPAELHHKDLNLDDVTMRGGQTQAKHHFMKYFQGLDNTNSILRCSSGMWYECCIRTIRTMVPSCWFLSEQA